MFCVGEKKSFSSLSDRKRNCGWCMYERVRKMHEYCASLLAPGVPSPLCAPLPSPLPLPVAGILCQRCSSGTTLPHLFSCSFRLQGSLSQL